ncbi:MAG TPA: hypothetical protein VFM49_24365, partial [Chloroflexia bacterium]|nr:hypothetical protein [Chloroflexia bacterium]
MGRARQVVDLVGGGEVGRQGPADVVLDHAQPGIITQRGDIARVAGEEVIENENVMAVRQQGGGEVR